MLFLTVFLERFCIDFGRDWEGFGPPWATKKKEFNAPKGEVDRNLVLESFLGGLGRVLGDVGGGIWEVWGRFFALGGERSEPRVACCLELSLGFFRFPLFFLPGHVIPFFLLLCFPAFPWASFFVWFLSCDVNLPCFPLLSLALTDFSCFTL